MKRSDAVIRALAGLGGATLVVIGLRFWLAPDVAAKFFGLSARPNGTELHAVVAYRDLWLGGLALAFAALGDWRALAFWFGFGTLVCFGDANIVIGAGGKGGAIAFHVVSGLLCAALTLACWSRRGR